MDISQVFSQVILGIVVCVPYFSSVFFAIKGRCTLSVNSAFILISTPQYVWEKQNLSSKKCNIAMSVKRYSDAVK